MIRVSRLNGKKVISSNGRTLGKIKGAEANVDNWTLTHLHVGLTADVARELGLKKPLIGSVKIRIPVNIVQGVADVVALKETLEGMKGVSEYKKLV